MKKNILVFPCGSEIALEIYRSVNKNIKNPIPEQDNLYEYQNSLLKHMTNIENVFTTQYFEQKENSYMKIILAEFLLLLILNLFHQ